MYATIPVFGATHWRGSWLARPVQWCGLVYGSALLSLADVRPAGPWRRVAHGITATGLLMTWPQTDKARQGLLPDFFFPDRQHRAGPPINPGTVQADMGDYLGIGRMYDVRRAAESGVLIHAPCCIRNVREEAGRLTFELDGWGDREYRIVLAGGRTRPSSIQWRPDGNKTEWQAVPDGRVTRPAERHYTIVRLRGRGTLAAQR
jgi:hypothetical protein